MRHFDVVVVGTGVTGQSAAYDCAKAGLCTAIVDRRDYGGTCALRGCDPKRVLLGAADAVDAVRRLEGNGPSGDERIDWAALQRFKRTFTDPAPQQIESGLVAAGVATLHGTARFTAPGRLEVDGEAVDADHIVVASGARPRPLGFPGQDLVTTSEGFMALESLPARLVFIGGGYISVEFAHLAAVAGARVTIVHRGRRLLEGFDEDLVRVLCDAYRAEGIDVVLDSPVRTVRASGGRLVVEAGDGSWECDMAVHGAGRVPDLDALGLEAGGVASGAHGIEVDGRLRSVSDPRVFACGDAAARGLPLTPVGIRQGQLVARVLAGEAGTAWGDPVTPSVVYADPPLAMVGLTEQGAKAAGLDVDVVFDDTTGWYQSRRVGVRASAAKTLVERGSGRIVGAHVLGPAAEELINVIAVAMAAGSPASAVTALPLTYPTAASALPYLL